jgi:hypothetical protein
VRLGTAVGGDGRQKSNVRLTRRFLTRAPDNERR